MKQDFIYQIFGSGDSTDLDCMVILDDIPTKNNDRRSSNYRKSIQKSHDLCDYYVGVIKELTGTDKEVNVNICSLKDGYVHRVFKGTCDEVSNSMYLTYILHEQKHPLLIKGLVERDIELKVLRTARVLLSFWSRTKYRPEVKSALRGDIYDKIECIKSINVLNLDLQKNVSDLDYAKTMAFQLGQTIALINGVELYTKKDISLQYPELKPLLYREKRDDEIIQEYLNNFIKAVNSMKFSKVLE